MGSSADRWSRIKVRAGAAGRVLQASVLVGLLGGGAMVPVGLVLRHGFGQPVNVYGELTAGLLFGSTGPAALLATHVLVSVALAVPLVAVCGQRACRGWLVGTAWGIATWLVLNTWLLPAYFGRPSPWIAWTGLWAGLLIHVVYGSVAGWGAGRFGPRGAKGSVPAT